MSNKNVLGAGGVLVASGLLAVATLGANCGDRTHEVVMRDGAVLLADVYEAAAPAPTILMRTPYGREGLAAIGTSYSSLGYSVIAQDMRGTGESDGTFLIFYDDGWGANQDGYDTVEWGSAGAWSDGQTCIYGASALAISGLAAAGAAPASLRCVYSLMGSGDLFGHIAYQGGALRESLVVGWLNALGADEALAAVLDSPYSTDELWQTTRLSDVLSQVSVPIYHTGGWYDIFTQSTADAFVGLQEQGGPGARGKQKLLIGPWTHGGTSGELTYPDGVFAGGEETRWFEHHLKGVDNGVDTEPPVKYYLMGDPDQGVGDGNRWITAQSWPPASTRTAFYLHDGGLLSRGAPPAGSAPEGFTFDPADPVPTLGGNNLNLPAGPMDQRPVLDRPDVRVWSSAVLDQPLTVVGKVSARLVVSSTAADTDFTVKLLDVYPDGRHMLVTDGVARMRFRDGQDHEVLMTPGQTYEVDVDLWSTAMVFEQGHSIAIAVSSSNAPRFDVNPNTGGWSHEGGPMVVAEQRIYQDQARASRLILPVIVGGL